MENIEKQFANRIKPDFSSEDILRMLEQERKSVLTSLLKEIEELKVTTDYPDTEDGRKCKYENSLYNSALQEVLSLISSKM